MGLKQLLIDSGDNFRQRLLNPDYTLPGGNNTAPLITKTLPGVEEDPNTNKELINSLTDGFVPGGGILAAERAFTDTQRITKFLLTGEGISYLTKELAIQRTTPQNLTSPTNRTRLPINLLAQIPSNITGLHFRRDGILDKDIEDNFNYNSDRYNPVLGSGGGGFIDTIVSAVSDNLQAKKYDTELKTLARIEGEDLSEHTLFSLYNTHKLDENSSNILKEYGGGAGSFFGIGKTQITKYPSGLTGFVDSFNTDNERAYLNFGPKNNPDSNSLLFYYSNFKNQNTPFSKIYGGDSPFNLRPVKLSTYTTSELEHRQYNESTTKDLNYPGSDNTDEFSIEADDTLQKYTTVREKIRKSVNNYQSGEPDVRKYKDTNTGNYTVNKNLSVDQLNKSWVDGQDPSIITRNSFAFSDETMEGLKDYVKFRIALIDTTNPLRDEVLMFRAHLENINDNFTGNWNSFKYNGRAENFYVYNGFDREISFSFKIGAQSKEELKPLWKKLNYMCSSTMPVYVNRRMRGRFVRLTIGDWLYEIPGHFPSIGLNWSTNFPWELNEAPNHYDPRYPVSQHPMILNVQVTFKPIHDHTPESDYTKPYIIRLSPTPKELNVNESTKDFNAEDFLASQNLDQTDDTVADNNTSIANTNTTIANTNATIAN